MKTFDILFNLLFFVTFFILINCESWVVKNKKWREIKKIKMKMKFIVLQISSSKHLNWKNFSNCFTIYMLFVIFGKNLIFVFSFPFFEGKRNREKRERRRGRRREFQVSSSYSLSKIYAHNFSFIFQCKSVKLFLTYTFFLNYCQLINLIL